MVQPRTRLSQGQRLELVIAATSYLRHFNLFLTHEASYNISYWLLAVGLALSVRRVHWFNTGPEPFLHESPWFCVTRLPLRP